MYNKYEIVTQKVVLPIELNKVQCYRFLQLPKEIFLIYQHLNEMLIFRFP